MERTTGKQKLSKLSFSPMKGNKYKNFLTSIMSPSTAKRRQPRKELQRPNPVTAADSGSIELSHESIYSSIEDVKKESAVCRKTSIPSVDSLEIDAIQNSPQVTEPKATVDVYKEPVYSVVHKTPVKPKRRSHVKESDIADIFETKEDNKMLQERLKELSEENCHLTKQLQDFKRQEEMKEATFHSKLQLEITQLEAETRKEVKSLSERIVLLMEEKSLLSDQLDLLHMEKREFQLKWEALASEARKKVDPDLHAKTIAEYRRLLEETKQRSNSELNEYKEKIETLSADKDSLDASLVEFKDKLVSSETRIKAMEGENQVLKEEKSRLNIQLEESRQLEEDHQKLLLSLLKVTETLAVERDILLNKTSFQESQQKELQTSVVGYSLNVGRLQEHIASLNKENLQEMLTLSKKSNREESIHEYYTQQLDILREKILNQNNTIIKIESEKRKLEMQLQSQWESFT